MKKNKLNSICVNNKNIFSCDRIVAFGDSMVEGAELLDHRLPIGKLKSKMRAYEWSNLLFKMDLYEQHLKNKEETKEMSYPAHLAKSLKKNFVNYGIGGNSLESICWQLLTDYDLKSGDLILIGLPPVERLWKFIRPNMFDSNVLLGWSETYKEFDNFLDWYSEPRMLWEYIKCLKILCHYKNTKHLHLYVIPQWQELSYLLNNVEVEWREKLSPELEQLYQSDLFLFSEPLNSLRFMHKLEHGHPTLRSHVKISEHILQHHIRPA